MKKLFFILFILACVSSNKSFSQNKAKYHYLTLTMGAGYDSENDEFYWTVNTEKDNPYAAVIDSLVKYRPKLKKNGVAELYYLRKDTSHIFFNYFRSRSECLQFLDERGWELYHIFSDISNNMYKSISTNPVFYFRKENTNISVR